MRRTTEVTRPVRPAIIPKPNRALALTTHGSIGGNLLAAGLSENDARALFWGNDFVVRRDSETATRILTGVLADICPRVPLADAEAYFIRALLDFGAKAIGTALARYQMTRDHGVPLTEFATPL